MMTDETIASVSCRAHSERGAGIVEAMVGVLLLSILGLTVAMSAVTSLRFQKLSEIGNIAMNLAVSRAEFLSGIRIDLLNDTYDSIESNLAVAGHTIKFQRTTNITVNSDGSRTIDIAVSSNSTFLPRAATYSTTFAPWES